MLTQLLGEELRLALINLLMLIFRKGYHQPFIQNLSEIMHTISKVLTDSYADIKRVRLIPVRV